MINMAIDSYIAVNVPLRDYRLAITKTALFTNTLVALPTGLGKTLSAAVVMYNYFRWFPDGKSLYTNASVNAQFFIRTQL
jgi:Fanconi anemia group M protein